jgi:CBS domain containing-hemolysin-like protein
VSATVAAAGAIAALLGLTGYLAAVETVVARTDVVRALRLREEGATGSDALLWLTEHRGAALNALLVATVGVRVTLGAVAAVLGWELLDGGVLGALVAVLVVSAVVLTGAEVAPRTLVLRSLEVAGCRLAPSARPLVRLLGPLARPVVVVGRALVPRREGVDGPYVADDEDDEANDEEEQDEELEPEERAMIRSIFELGETRVREVMVPRPDLVTVPEDATFDDVVGVVTEHGVSRIPVHEPDEPDTIVGVVYAKDLLKRVATDRRRRWSDLVRLPTFVPETKRCDELLRELQEATVHLALVIDEYGDLVGLVTIEDILEEIVGEIVDEHDHEEPLVEVLEDGWRIDARLAVDDLNQLLGADLPEEGWDTVGGLVFGTLGRVPLEGERVELAGVCLAVERVQGRRVAKVHATLSEPAGAEEART